MAHALGLTWARTSAVHSLFRVTPRVPHLPKFCLFGRPFALKHKHPTRPGCLPSAAPAPDTCPASGECYGFEEQRDILLRTLGTCVPPLLLLSLGCVLTWVPQALVAGKMGRVGVLPGGLLPIPHLLSPK